MRPTGCPYVFQNHMLLHHVDLLSMSSTLGFYSVSLMSLSPTFFIFFCSIISPHWSLPIPPDKAYLSPYYITSLDYAPCLLALHQVLHSFLCLPSFTENPMRTKIRSVIQPALQ
jgi:hypothetical protein